MKKDVIFLLFLLTTIAAHAQDYFTDAHASGTPIIFKNTNDKQKLLFSTSVNAGDNSIKANIYQQYWLDKSDFVADQYPARKSFIGWGLSGKAKTTDGLGKLFGSGEIDPGFTLGGYFALSRMNWKVDTSYSRKALILGFSYTEAHYQFFDPAQSYSNQTSAKYFHSPAVSLSYVDMLHPGSTNLYWGASLTLSKKSNYDDLDNVTLKDDSLISGTGTMRTVTKVNPLGDTYAIGTYKTYSNVNVRANISYVPGALDNKIGFIFYPSVDLSSAYSAKYNLGLSFAYLKDGSPSTTIGAITFELDDLNNAGGSTKPFLKRAFKIGISTTLNIINGQ